MGLSNVIFCKQIGFILKTKKVMMFKKIASFINVKRKQASWAVLGYASQRDNGPARPY